MHSVSADLKSKCTYQKAVDWRRRSTSTLALAATSFVALSICASAASAAALPGDLNGDSKITSSDISVLTQHYAQPATPVQGDLDSSGRVDARDLSILLSSVVDSQATSTPTTPPTPPPSTQTTKLYVDTAKTSWIYVYGASQASWRATHPEETALLKKIADQPQAIWLGYSTDDAVMARAFKEAGATQSRVVFTLYNIPYRDNGQYAAGNGGAATPAAYKAWIDRIAANIGDKPTLLVVEPDALPMTIGDRPNEGRTSAEIMAERYALINYAATKLSALSDTKVYLDAGNSSWGNTPEKMAERLKLAGIDKATGFSSNVANFNYTQNEVTYDNKISSLVGGKHFVIDTSIDGNGPRPKPTDGSTPSGEYYWCNPPGRALGDRPTKQTGVPNVDAYLWVMTPGNSNGPCNGGPGGGAFWLDRALEISRNAHW